MLAEKLRKQAKRGSTKLPARLWMGGQCDYYWHADRDAFPTFEEWEKGKKLLARYKRLLAFVEAQMQWVEVNRIHWADNSIDVVERNQFGQERTRMILAPGGDACY